MKIFDFYINFSTKKIYIIGLMFFVLSSLTFAQQDVITYSTVHKHTDIPFEFPEKINISIPNKDFNIVDFGGVGDGLTLNTKAFENVIATCSKSGGGRVIVPAGIWLTGPIHLKSNTELHLEKEALILFSRNFNDYPMIESSFEGNDQVRCTSPINAVNATNIAITGSGIIDGSGDAWRPVKRFKMTSRQWNALISSGGVVDDKGAIWWPSQSALDGEIYFKSNGPKNKKTIEDFKPIRDYLRPVMVRFVNCENVLLDGPTFQNSPAWNIHPLLCENLVVKNVTVRNPWYSQNGDGIDIESCRNVIVMDSQFDVGDDAICIKSGKNEFGRKRGIPSEKIIVQNCTVFHGHGGVTTGSEMSGGVHDVWVTDCTFLGTDVGLRFKSTRGRGGTVQNMYFKNISMIDIKEEAILFNLFYENDFGGTSQIPPIDEGTPVFREISFDLIKSLNAETSIFIRGLPEKSIDNISFKNVHMTSKNGIQCDFSKNISFKSVTLKTLETPVIKINTSSDVLFKNSDFTYPDGILIDVLGEKSMNIKFDGSNLSQPKIHLGKSVNKNAVRFQE